MKVVGIGRPLDMKQLWMEFLRPTSLYIRDVNYHFYNHCYRGQFQVMRLPVHIVFKVVISVTICIGGLCHNLLLFSVLVMMNSFTACGVTTLYSGIEISILLLLCSCVVSPMTSWTCYSASSAFKVLCLLNFIMPICVVYDKWHEKFFLSCCILQ